MKAKMTLLSWFLQRSANSLARPKNFVSLQKVKKKTINLTPYLVSKTMKTKRIATWIQFKSPTYLTTAKAKRLRTNSQKLWAKEL